MLAASVKDMEERSLFFARLLEMASLSLSWHWSLLIQGSGTQGTQGAHCGPAEASSLGD